MYSEVRFVPVDDNLIFTYKDYFDLDVVYNRDKRGKVLFQFLKDKIDLVSSINSYSEFVRERRAAVEEFKKNATLSEITYLRYKGNLEKLFGVRQTLRNAYAYYWAFDAKIKELPLIDKATDELMKIFKKYEDISSFYNLLIPKKTFLEEKENDITPKINAIESMGDKVRNRVKFFTLCNFFDEVIWAEGYEDVKIRMLFFPYALYGLELQKMLIDNGLLSTRNPYEWLRFDFEL
jgi:hypothetical protein